MGGLSGRIEEWRAGDTVQEDREIFNNIAPCETYCSTEFYVYSATIAEYVVIFP